MIAPAPKEIRPYPGRQTKFLELYHVKRLIYAGQKNGGKTWCAFLDFLRDIHHPDACGLFIRRSFPSLEDAIEKSRRIFSHYGAEYNGQRHCWTFPSGARFYMRPLADENDLQTVTGQEYTCAYIDEAGFIPTKSVELVWSCCRTQNPGINVRLRLFTNPQGVSAPELWDEYMYSHAEGEVKNWVRDMETDEWVEVETGGESKTWLFSKREENLSAQADYALTLANLSKDLRRAYLSGELVIESQPDQLIEYEHFDKALALDPGPEQGFWIVSLDVAGEGLDSSVLTFGRMNQVKEVIEFKKKKVPELFEILCEYFHRYRGQILCLIDSVGLGTALPQLLQKEFPQWTAHIIAIGSESAKLSEKMKIMKYGTELKFYSYRDFICWQAKLAFEGSKINLSRIRNSKSVNQLKKEIGAVKWKENDIGQIQTTKKTELRKVKNLGGSPDRFDSMCYYILGLLFYMDRMKGGKGTDDGWTDYGSDPVDPIPPVINGSGSTTWC